MCTDDVTKRLEITVNIVDRNIASGIENLLSRLSEHESICKSDAATVGTKGTAAQPNGGPIIEEVEDKPSA